MFCESSIIKKKISGLPEKKHHIQTAAPNWVVIFVKFIIVRSSFPQRNTS